MSGSRQSAELLDALRKGDRNALDQVVAGAYDELHRMAHRALARQGGPLTMRTTGLLHETYLKLVGQERLTVSGRSHFMAVAATAMRHIVIDHVRGRSRLKRGGGSEPRTLGEDDAPIRPDLEEVIDVDRALTRLERFDERLVRVVECRFFAGLTVEETAAALGLAPRTVDRAWQKAKAWLHREIHETQ